MAHTTPHGQLPPDAQARARDGVHHLQAAARELIAAARAALDVAEEMVNDPESVASLAGTLATVGEMARRFTGAPGWPAGEPASSARPSSPPADDPRVERIRVT